jgi:uncharacterized membrane protein YqhA
MAGKEASPRSPSRSRRLVSRTIFFSRWLQLPLYIGLIAAQGIYVWQFWVELSHLLSAAFGDQHAVQAVTCAVQAAGVDCATLPAVTGLSEATVMLVVLGLVDVVMISNLLIMVIIGGYETFVSRLDLDDHPDQPEWLSHVNASVLKVKLGTAIIGIVDPSVEDLHQRVAVRREDADRPDRHPPRVPVVGDRDRIRGADRVQQG